MGSTARIEVVARVAKGNPAWATHCDLLAVKCGEPFACTTCSIYEGSGYSGLYRWACGQCMRELRLRPKPYIGEGECGYCGRDAVVTATLPD